MNTSSMNTRLRRSTGLTQKQILDIFMKIRETVMKHIKTGITQERKDAAVKKINGLLNKLGLGYTIKKIEKSLLEKIMEKIMVKNSGGSVTDSLSKKLGLRREEAKKKSGGASKKKTTSSKYYKK